MLMGVIIGFQIDILFNISDNLNQSELRNALSAMMSLISFVCLLVLHLIPETFQRESVNWKDYLDRFFILDKDGVNIFYYNFASEKIGETKQEVNRDLISGGLTGIEMMIKEMSLSDKHLDMLEQSDKKILFVHGKFTVCVLFTTEYLAIHKQKILKFQEEFEYINYDVIKKFSGMVSDIKDVERLMKKYFGINTKSE
jgi:hypothetical protein